MRNVYMNSTAGTCELVSNCGRLVTTKKKENSFRLFVFYVYYKLP